MWQCGLKYRQILGNIISACYGLCVVATFSEDEAKAPFIGLPTMAYDAFKFS